MKFLFFIGLGALLLFLGAVFALGEVFPERWTRIDEELFGKGFGGADE